MFAPASTAAAAPAPSPHWRAPRAARACADAHGRCPGMPGTQRRLMQRRRLTAAGAPQPCRAAAATRAA